MTRTAARLAAVVVVLALVGLLRPLVAGAAVLPACPDAPQAYGGTDPAIAEMRDARIDAAAVCAATAARLDEAHDDATAAAGKLDALHAQLAGTLAVSLAGNAADAPAFVQVTNPPDQAATQTVRLDDSTSTWLHGDAAVLLAALWVLVGAVVGAVVVPPLLRVVRA